MTLLNSEVYRVFCNEGKFINPTISNKNSIPYFIAYDNKTKRLYIKKIKNNDENIYRLDQSDYTPEFLINYKDPYVYNREEDDEFFIDVKNFTEMDYYFLNDLIILSYVKSSNLYVCVYDNNGNELSNNLIDLLSFKPSISYSIKSSILYLFYYNLTSKTIKSSNSSDSGENWSEPIILKNTRQYVQSLSSIIEETDSIDTAYITYKDQTYIRVTSYNLE